ncbi:metallo-dependent phosphatase [Chloropicon primus]|uniref:Metallo-dependent phosphatase n=2 Tax=Chloropicon primus TaxID=1764295 RepID=A0A5B8MI99_9CHLO|nr:metallo-dependent phosphatase [Chloropicon primus]UPQ98309.1 metallo-dependent phosphatase [Chloropicon primus]|eukprot:QDZ19100.1 metallo-dependent phosphatase [Chloropicon primus]
MGSKGRGPSHRGARGVQGGGRTWWRSKGLVFWFFTVAFLVSTVACLFLVSRSGRGVGWRDAGGVAIPRWLEGEDALFSVGLITDLQYSDIPDRTMRYGGARRYYRNSLAVLREAREAWREANATTVMVLGDSIDRSTLEVSGGNEPGVALERVVRGFEGLQPNFVLGNHDVEAIPSRSELLGALGMGGWGEGAAHYALRPHQGTKFLVLDAYAVSVYTDERRGEALSTLARERGDLEGNLKGPGGLKGLRRRFNALGGELGGDQMRWLEREIRESEGLGENVVVFSHIPISPSAVSWGCGPMCLAWDYDVLLDLLRRSRCVKAFFAGHDHAGGFHSERAYDAKLRAAAGRGGARILHHVTVEGVIETPVGSTAFATLEFHGRGILLRGRGRIRTRWLPFR